MNIKSLLIIPVVVLTWATHVCAEGESIDVQGDTDTLMENYQKSTLTGYRSFDDFYLIMKRNGYPNLFSELHGGEIDPRDFNNPQTLNLYKEKRREVEKRELLIRQKQNPMDAFKPKSKEELLESDLQFISMYRKTSAFIKTGYYQYFKDHFQKPNTTHVEICISIDRVSSGILGNSNVTPLSVIETKEILKKKTMLVISKLDEDSYSDVEYILGGRTIPCDAQLKVDEGTLDLLFGDQLVASISNPKMAKLKRFHTH